MRYQVSNMPRQWKKQQKTQTKSKCSRISVPLKDFHVLWQYAQHLIFPAHFQADFHHFPLESNRLEHLSCCFAALLHYFRCHFYLPGKSFKWPILHYSHYFHCLSVDNPDYNCQWFGFHDYSSRFAALESHPLVYLKPYLGDSHWSAKH